jgi:hypothetical protein
MAQWPQNLPTSENIDDSFIITSKKKIVIEMLSFCVTAFPLNTFGPEPPNCSNSFRTNCVPFGLKLVLCHFFAHFR